MIHSLAGGQIKSLKYADLAKVQITSGMCAGDIYWYIAHGAVSVGDKVMVPFGKANTLVEGKVLRIDKNVSCQVSPIPLSKAKKVARVIK